MSTTSPEILVELDRSKPRGLRSQVEDELREAIRTGRLTPGTRLPSTRALAADLDVTRGVIVAAYDQLLAEGYLVSRAGSGTVVGAAPGAEPGPCTTPNRNARPEIDFLPGLPDLSLFPRATWARACRATLATLPSASLGYVDPRGLPELRDRLADYLGRVRGVCTTPENIVVCDGFTHGISLVAPTLRALGHSLIAGEDPGHTAPRRQIEWFGAGPVCVDVDGEGIIVDELRRTGARAVIVTPAHQYPTGAVLSPRRRAELAAWARDVDGYVIEDDYDAEYRYDRHPIGAFQGVAPERVIYGGTLSKSLAPGLRLGWLVLPPALVDAVIATREMTGMASASLAQATIADFLARGDLDRHLRRTRRIYRQRRDTLIAALARHFPEATPSGIAAGLHLLVGLPPGVDDRLLAERAAAAGVGVEPVSKYRWRPRPDQAPGLVLGYGSVTPAQSERGVKVLAELARTASP
jgi:GntR family transcriptional regulator / MocR family aminotransferase